MLNNHSIISAKKKFGQNFLADRSILSKIVDVAGDIENRNVLEVGAGLGALTNEILLRSPKKFVSIEIDKDLYNILVEEIKSDNFQLINEDALKVDESEFFNGNINVIANLPYNVGTNLLIKWLENIELFDSFTLLLQKEVVDRIVANPYTKEYGRLSIISQSLCNVKKAFDVKPSFFRPPPKVMSSIVYLSKKDNINLNIKKLSYITLKLFSQRRKKIKKIIDNMVFNKELDESIYDVLDLNKRAEEISVKDYIDISNKVNIVK